MHTRRARRTAVSAALRIALVAGVAGAAATATGHDEDWRKLADKLPAIFGPVWSLGQQVDSDVFLRNNDTFDADGVTCNANIPVNNFGLGSTEAQDCWGYVSPSGREYAIITLSNGYGFVEVTDPDNPVIVGAISAPSSPWHDVKVVGQYAYGVSEGGGGIQVMNMGNIDGNVAGPRVSNIGNFQTSGHTSTHNIIVNLDSDALYVCGTNIGNGGLFRVDLSSATSPAIAGGYTDIYVHDAQVVTPTSGPFAGREIAFCAGGLNGGFTQTGLRIVDMTNPNSPQVLSTLFYPSAGYAHQVWLSDDGNTLYLNDETDEQGGLVPQTTTRIIDVSDLTNPQFVGTTSSGLPSIDHNLYVRDGYMYQANYTSGLRVFDIADPLDPVQVGFFDTFPSSNAASFNGAWSTYPFFPSGTVLISDIERGLFVVTVDAIMDRLALSISDAPAILDPAGGESVTVEIREQGLVLDPSTAELVVDQGGQQTVVQGTPAGGDLYTFEFPPVDCGTDVSYFFRALDEGQLEFTLPADAPNNAFDAIVASDSELTFDDDYQLNLGWTVVSTAADGQWQRAVPSDDSRGAPGADFDGSGFCYVTDNADGNSDVDDGFTRLTSPTFDLEGGGTVSFAYWLNDISGGPLSATDNLVVEIRPDNVTPWTEIARYGSASGSWRTDEIVVDASLASTTTQVRFTVSDDDPQGVVEAGVDAFQVSKLSCTDANPSCNAADVAFPFNVLDLTDVDTFIAAFTNGDLAADVAAPFGVLDLTDVDAFIAAFLGGCP
ncbi:MAG: choice-of-anchor B family protein [Planctomycetota bacterium]